MKKIYTLMICFILIGCGSQKNTDIAAKTETATERFTATGRRRRGAGIQTTQWW